MELLHLQRKDISDERWDRAIDTAFNGMPYAYSWYLDIVCDGKWNALLSADYNTVMPLPFNRKNLGYSQLFTPYFTQQLGVFSKTSQLLDTDRFLRAIPAHYRKINYQLNEHTDLPESLSFAVRSKTNMVLDLQENYPDLRNRFQTAARQKLKKHKDRFRYEVNTVSVPELVSTYRQVLQQKVRLPTSAYATITQLIQTAIQRNKGKIYAARSANGEIGTVRFCLESNGRIILLFGVTTSAGRRLHSNICLFDYLIEQNAKKKLLLDFEGSSIPAVAKFFKNFNPEVRSFPVIERDTLPAWIRWLRRVRR